MDKPIRAITISREFGSGGGSIARILAHRLSWRLVDSVLIDEIARIANVNPQLAAYLDESVDPWFHRLTKALWHGGYEGSATWVLTNVFDADAMASLCQRVITEAVEIGQCIIVGRGGQCILQDRPDVFHVAVYAPLDERIDRLRDRKPPDMDLAALAQEADHRRAAYIRRYFGQDWTDRHLYNLAICSSCGLERAAAVVIEAAGLNEPT
jgi:cytidylate kinase